MERKINPLTLDQGSDLVKVRKEESRVNHTVVKVRISGSYEYLNTV